MTTHTSHVASPGAPSFSVRSARTLRALAVVTICAALTVGFLAQVWRAPSPSEHSLSRAAAAAPSRV